ncbi:RNA helicase [Linderina macrospora]|uniref:RNA helicase n=1 Tax=Linderina macrospora TaxID=4868 RepID=A0ACC1JH12_9FUNG|nr:RNA helicase [Linderina macrospora]
METGVEGDDNVVKLDHHHRAKRSDLTHVRVSKNMLGWPQDADIDGKFSRVQRDLRLDHFRYNGDALKRCMGFGISTAEFIEWADKFIADARADKIDRLEPDRLVPLLVRDGRDALDNIIINQFFGYLARMAPDVIQNITYLRKITDLRYPHEWSGGARKMQRKIIMHVGPTNSGKTYHALQRLQSAQQGIYCSPLRLLAYEVYNRMTSAGISCNLVTGEERRGPDFESGQVQPAGYDISGQPFTSVLSCTIEMAPSLNYNVAVIDEIQMISDTQRGWAWTSALLNLKARELHLCGEPSAVPIVKRICAQLDEEVEVREYSRLGQLNIDKKSLNGNWRNVRKGDCVVTFSRKGIFQIKNTIEQATGLKCAVIYGGLPPEARVEQARLFNDPDSGYDVLVASDAVGMGINLSIKRVVFVTMSKFDGVTNRPISVSQTRQIGGRAGRYGAGAGAGTVTTMEARDLRFLNTTMNRMPPALDAAGLKPTGETIEMFSHQFPKVKFAQLWRMFQDVATVSDNYFLCSFRDQERIAEAIEELPLSVRDRYQFLYAPINVRDPIMLTCTVQYARAVAEHRECRVMDVIKVPKNVPTNMDALKVMEQWHKGITLYLWLSFHFTEIFTQPDVATETKVRVEKMIQEGLELIRAKRKSGQLASEQERSMQDSNKEEIRKALGIM